MQATTIRHKSRTKTKWNWKLNWVLYAMLVPAFVLIVVFNYIPMYGLIIAFQDFQPINGFWGSPFVGIQWFKLLFDIPDFKQVLFNTLYIAVLKMIFGTLAPILFALLLNEVRNKTFKKFVQTSVYFPNFLSWVIVSGIFMTILSADGPVNNLLHLFGFKTILFLGDNHWFRFTLVATDLWKSFGWNSILYLAALTGINPELYESALLDGANRLKQTWHVTIPGIMPTILLLVTLNMGNILDAGFDQVFNLYNPIVYQTGDIIDTFVYRSGIVEAQYSFATAVGLGKSVVGILLIAISYRLAYKFSNYRIF